MDRKGTGEYEPPRERENLVEHAWLFDVDGVLIHPVEKKVTEEQLFDEIIAILERGEPVALNTGRSIDFMVERILTMLEGKLQNRNTLQNMFAIGEKGLVLVSYDEEGQRHELVDENVKVPEHIQQKVRKLIASQFADSMFYDETKRTMVSTEMRDGYDWHAYKERQKALDEQLLKLLDESGLAHDFKIDPSRIATDIEHKHVGKALGARRFLDWLQEKKIQAKKFVAFGDSKSDVAMGEEIHRQGLPVQFVFVGEKDLLAGKHFDFPITYTDQHCEKGALEYLQTLSKN